MANLFKGAALFIGGAIAGAAAAMLLSPQTAEKVRHELSDLATEAKKRAQGYCEQVKNDFAQAQAAAENAAEEMKARKQSRRKKEA